MPAVRSRGSALPRIAAIQWRTNPTSYGAMNGDEHRYSRIGRAGVKADLAAEFVAIGRRRRREPVVVGLRPGDVDRSAGTPCSSIASCFCASFQTITRSGTSWISPLVVR